MSAYAQSELKRLGVPTRVEKRAAKDEAARKRSAVKAEYRRYLAAKRQDAAEADRVAAIAIPEREYCECCGEEILEAVAKARLARFCPHCEQMWLKENALQRTELAALALVQGLGAMRYGGAYINPVKTGTCVYCGYSADTWDHVIPTSFSRPENRRKRRGALPGLKVECCRECNTYLGSRWLTAVPERARYLYGRYKVRRRYSQQRLRHLFVVANLGRLTL